MPWGTKGFVSTPPNAYETARQQTVRGIGQTLGGDPLSPVRPPTSYTGAPPAVTGIANTMANTGMTADQFVASGMPVNPLPQNGAAGPSMESRGAAFDPTGAAGADYYRRTGIYSEAGPYPGSQASNVSAAAPAGGQGSAFQQNYNYLASVNPELAMIYGLSPFHNQEFKQGVDAAQHGGAAFNPEGNSWSDSLGNSLYAAFNEPSPGSNAQNIALGLPSGWAPSISPQWLGQYFDPTGRTITIGGKSYTLPVADTSYAQPTGWATKR